MALSLFSHHVSPIALDFGSSSVKMLQTTTGDRPAVVAIDELSVPEDVRLNADQRVAFIADELPRRLRAGKFKGRKIVCSPLSTQTLVLHMQVPPTDGAAREGIIKQQLQSQLGCSPNAVVVRWVEVPGTQRDGQSGREIICFAIAREEVMRHIELLRKAKLEVVGVHSEPQAILWSFHHLHRRTEDQDTTTMYVDLGWGNTKVAISHASDLVFAKCIQLGGRHLDQAIAGRLKCDLPSAHAHRMTLEASPVPAALPAQPSTEEEQTPAILRAAMSRAEQEGTLAEPVPVATAEDRRGSNVPRELANTVSPGAIPGTEISVDLTEQLDAVADELLMCVRYHRALFPGRKIDRVIFLGGEARQMGLCQHVARSLKLPAQLGDPLARLILPTTVRPSDMPEGTSQPGWSVACGLCNQAAAA